MSNNSIPSKRITICPETQETFHLIVGYSNPKLQPRTVSIKAELKGATSNFAVFQFYAEFKPKFERKWIIDTKPPNMSTKYPVPYYCLLEQSSEWGYRWSDRPTYNLCSNGIIYFNTFISKVNKNTSPDPKEWSYEVLCGFSWGMMSEDGTNINPVPIKPIPRERLQLFSCLLKCHYPKASFALVNNYQCKFEDSNCNLW